MGKKRGVKKRKLGEAPFEELGEEEEYDKEPIDAVFRFCDPYEDDYHSVRSLLVNGEKYPPSVSISSLAAVICNQGNIGGTVKSDDKENNVFGLLTILNIKQYYEELKSVYDLIMEKARLRADTDALNLLESLIKDADITASSNNHNHGDSSSSSSRSSSSSSTTPTGIKKKDCEKNIRPRVIMGLVINERFRNLPLELIPTLHTEVIDKDVQWSVTSPEMDEDERPFYFFTHLISVSTFYKQSKKLAEKSKTFCSEPTHPDKENANLGELVYGNFEDEHYKKHSNMSFSWPTGQNVKFGEDKILNANTTTNDTKKQRTSSTSGSCGETLEEHRLVYVIPFSKAVSVARSLKKLQNK